LPNLFRASVNAHNIMERTGAESGKARFVGGGDPVPKCESTWILLEGDSVREHRIWQQDFSEPGANGFPALLKAASRRAGMAIPLHVMSHIEKSGVLRCERDTCTGERRLQGGRRPQSS
jgi:hypothetical protein